MQPDDPETIIGESAGLGDEWCGCHRQPRATPTFSAQPCEPPPPIIATLSRRQRPIPTSSNRLLRQDLIDEKRINPAVAVDELGELFVVGGFDEFVD